MVYWLFLDDERSPPEKPIHADLPDEPIIARSFDEFVAVVELNGCPAFVTFDHDLGIGKTGMDCVDWFVNWVLDDPARLVDDFRFDVHSMNPIGAKNMRARLESFLEFIK